MVWLSWVLISLGETNTRQTHAHAHTPWAFTDCPRCFEGELSVFSERETQIFLWTEMTWEALSDEVEPPYLPPASTSSALCPVAAGGGGGRGLCWDTCMSSKGELVRAGLTSRSRLPSPHLGHLSQKQPGPWGQPSWGYNNGCQFLRKGCGHGDKTTVTREP